MRLRAFTAPDMPSAMKMVREALGEEAVILSSHTEKLSGLVKVTAAVERDEDLRPELFELKNTVAKAQKQAQAAAWFKELESLLQFHNVPQGVIRRIIANAEQLDLSAVLALQKLAGAASKPGLELKLLTSILSASFAFLPLPLNNDSYRLMLIGLPGTGKTLTVAKLATRAVMEGKQVAVVTTDTKRAGGIEQLSAFTDILSIPLQVAENPQALRTKLGELPAGTSVLVDTAGCNPLEEGDMAEMGQLASIPGIEPVLALQAGMDSLEAADAARAFAFTAVKRLIVTRLDASRRLGSLLAAAEASGLAFSHSVGSPRVVGEAAVLDAAMLARLLLQHKNQENRIAS